MLLLPREDCCAKGFMVIPPSGGARRMPSERMHLFLVSRAGRIFARARFRGALSSMMVERIFFTCYTFVNKKVGAHALV